MEKGEPTYFDIVGKSAMDRREDLKVPVEGEVIPISSENRVDIEVQSGMAYTHEGKKAAAKELGDYMIQLAQLGMIPPTVMSKFLQVLLETYQFGPTNGVVQDMEDFEKEGQMTDAQMDKIKVAVAEVLKDAEIVGPGAEEKLIQTTKIGAVEALKDTGLIEKGNDDGIEAEKTKQEMAIAREKADAEMMKGEEKLDIEKAKAMQDMELKEQKAKEDSAIKRATALHNMKIKEKQSKKKKEDK